MRSLPARIFRSFWHQWRDELTPAGKIVFWGICVTGLGTIELQMPIYQLFFALVALISVGAATGALFRPRVDVRANFPMTAAVGQAVTGQVHVTNLRKIMAYEVGANVFGLPESFETNLDENILPRLPPGQETTFPVLLTPSRRGRYELPALRVYSLFPFALGRSGRANHSLGPLLVTPAFEPLASIRLPFHRRLQPEGMTRINHLGESPEYIGNREYVPGEPIRRIDFRAWARLGAPVVREYQEEFHAPVALVLDTSLPGGPPRRGAESPTFEAAVSLTAAIASALSEGDYVADLVACGADCHTFGAHSRRGRLTKILEVLADVAPASHEVAEELSEHLGNRMRTLTAAVVVLLGWSPARRRLLEEIGRQGCRVKTIVVLPEKAHHEIPREEIPNATLLTPEEIARGGLVIY